MKVAGCSYCQYCYSHEGECAQKDDMQEIYKALYQADMLVFSSPVYWYGFTAQLKAMIDRMFVSVTKPLPITSTALLVTYGDTDTTVVDAIIVHFKAFTGYVGWENKGIITQGEVDNKGDINGRKSLEDARKLGMGV
jgi:multimeric flavodoxin WrbA